MKDLFLLSEKLRSAKFVNITQAKKITGLSYLGGLNISAKLDHSEQFSHMYTYIIYLAPSKDSGYNICPFASPECIKSCLKLSGRAAMDKTSGLNIIHNARVLKTRLFFENNKFFMQWLFAEILQAKKKANKDNYFFSVRLNGTSDINYNNILVNGKNIFDIFSNVQFYDYTKQASKFNNIAKNYHLTFSYTGHNIEECKKLLNKGHNIAVVFSTKRNKKLPVNFLGKKVIDGDITDYRVNDKKNSVVGLRFKLVYDKKINTNLSENIFVVNENLVA